MGMRLYRLWTFIDYYENRLEPAPQLPCMNLRYMQLLLATPKMCLNHRGCSKTLVVYSYLNIIMLEQAMQADNYANYMH